MADQPQDRRTFLAAGASLAGALLLGRAGAAEDEAQWVAVPLSEHEALADVGGSTDVELPDGTQVLVARVEEDRFVCVALKCTHNNCDVEYDHRRRRIVCPCHKSAFGLDGQPLDGPAQKPLPVYECGLGAVIRFE